MRVMEEREHGELLIDAGGRFAVVECRGGIASNHRNGVPMRGASYIEVLHAVVIRNLAWSMSEVIDTALQIFTGSECILYM